MDARRDGALLRAVRMEKKIFFFSRERRVKECNFEVMMLEVGSLL